MSPLVVPPAAQRDVASVQMLSAWIAENGFHCTLNIGFFAGQDRDEAGSWGILIADLIRHIGDAWEDERGVHAHETVAAVLQVIQAEMERPTSPTSGAFHPGHS